MFIEFLNDEFPDFQKSIEIRDLNEFYKLFILFFKLLIIYIKSYLICLIIFIYIILFNKNYYIIIS